MRGTGLWSTGPQTLARTGGASGVRAGGRRRAECVGGRIGAWAGDSVRGGRAGERFGNSRRKHILPEKDGSPL